MRQDTQNPVRLVPDGGKLDAAPARKTRICAIRHGFSWAVLYEYARF